MKKIIVITTKGDRQDRSCPWVIEEWPEAKDK